MEHLETSPPSGGARRFFLALGLLALLAAALVRPATADEAPRFLLEKITVAGNRRPASARIVIAESLLVTGQSYGEDQLREAVYRIKRLPFIVDADFSLRKGSERGQYELVVTVEESRPLFVGYDLEGSYTAFSTLPGLPRRQSHFSSSGSLTGGAREFVGAAGLLFVSASEDSYQAGYTRYDLFGPGSFLSVALSADHNGHLEGPSLSAGFPLTFNQSLRVNATGFNFDVGPGQSLVRRSIDLRWLYDTTDDPIFPTRGTQGNVAVGYFHERDVVRPADPAFAEFRQTEQDWELSFNGTHFWPVTAHQAVSVGLSGGIDRATASDNFFFQSSGPQTSYEANLLLGHSLDLVSGERARRFGDLRLETTAQYQGFHASDAIARISETPNPSYRLSLRTGLVFRNPWAVIRLGFSYLGKVM